MPPSLDVYVLSRLRDRPSIERFIDAWVDRDASEDRQDEELMMLPLSASGASDAGDDWEWEPARTLTHAIQRGLDRPSRAFVLYLKPRGSLVDGVTLGFTTHEHVVFGVSVHDPFGRDDRLEVAKELLTRLAHEFHGERGYVACGIRVPLVAGTIPAADADKVVVSWVRPIS